MSSGGAVVVGAFLLGRLGSHVVVGALLGVVGGAARIPPEVRAGLLVVAGLVVVAFAVRLVGRREVPRSCGSRRAVPSGAPVVRGAMLGAVTVLVPCGVTLSVELVAVSSGSALGGMAVMAGFVAGTAPAFALLGLLVRHAATTRLVTVAAVAALVAGTATVGAGLRLGGWLPWEGATTGIGPAVAGSDAGPVSAAGAGDDAAANGRGAGPGNESGTAPNGTAPNGAAPSGAAPSGAPPGGAGTGGGTGTG
ncbi:urease accessory protein UreH domain-containing protein, partial [Sphaerisporangium aureirubrum]